MEFRNYAKHSLPDYILCLAITAGLMINVYQGFYLPAALSADWLRLVAVTAALDLILMLAAYSRRNAVTGVLVGVLILALGIVALQMTGLLSLAGEDAEANGGWWYFATLLGALAVFLLTRTLWGSAVLFVLGALILAMLSLLQYVCYPVGLVVFLWSSGTMYLYKRYRASVLRTSTVKNAFASVLACSMALMTLAMAAAGGIWWGIVRPLDPPTREAHLITRIMSLEVLETLGISQTVHVMDFDAYSNEEDEDFQRLTSQTGDDETLPDESENRRSEGEDADDDSESSAYLESDESEEGTAVTYDRPTTLGVTLTAVGFLAVITAAAALVYYRRKNWFRRLEKLGAEGRVVYLYGWFTKKLPLLGVPARGADTPYEYAERVSEQTRFLTAEGADWNGVTEIFVRTCYGGLPLTAEDNSALESFCSRFHANCRRRLGVKNIVKWVRL
ncbi:MAG: DUF4129 domain-containing protein [Oscillospiraceae bacterium]|nr:DUF4129 domain-containing protein [Oscillospiraceae bacterium]